jgi:hypothetical protein
MAVELAELVAQLRTELTKAMQEGRDEALRFSLGPVELELTLAVAKEATPGAKVRFWVVEAGADAKASSSRTQRIKLTLEPHLAGHPGIKPDISGDEMTGET